MNIEIGIVKPGREIGYQNRNSKFIYAPCVDCGKPRWVRLVDIKQGGKTYRKRCHACANRLSTKKRIKGGSEHFNWKGGRYEREGYIFCWVSPDDFFYPMADGRSTIREHRLVMAKHLGRCLHRWEIVHHKHTKYPAGSVEDKQDNRIDNLQLVTDDRHKQISILERRIKLLETKVEEQGKFIKLLQWQIKGTKDELVRDI